MTIFSPVPPSSAGRGQPLRRYLVWGAAGLSCAVALVSYRYLVGVGPVPAGIAANRYFSRWLVVHAAGAATALMVGPLQFMSKLRSRWPAAHRFVGRLYAAGCLCGGAAGLVLAGGTTAGPVAGLGFAGLGAAWLVTTAVSVVAIRGKAVGAHRRWMLRSFALAFAAVTLRIYLPASSLLGFDSLASYWAIAWLCWVPNLIFAEWLMGREPRPSPPGSYRVPPSRPTTVQR